MHSTFGYFNKGGSAATAIQQVSRSCCRTLDDNLTCRPDTLEAPGPPLCDAHILVEPAALPLAHGAVVGKGHVACKHKPQCGILGLKCRVLPLRLQQPGQGYETMN